MTVHAVLLIPAEGDPLNLLAEGPCGARPPVVIQHPSEGTWHDYGWAPSDRRALVLAWDGKPVAVGCWLADCRGAWGDTAERCSIIMRRGPKACMGIPPALGTLILLDADGREIT